jgi:HTH-type transcriptional regulator/antitoxin HigA
MTTINQFKPDVVFHPGETLQEKLEELNMGPKEFAIRTGKPEKTIIAILKGDSSVTPEMAVLFESVLKIPADFWLRKQFRYDEYNARVKRTIVIEGAKEWAKCFPIADMVNHGWLDARTKAEDKVTELLHFFEVSSPAAWEDYFFNQQLKVTFRISLAHTKEPYAISAWIRQGEIQARQLQCGPYSETKFKKALFDIKKLMATQPNHYFEPLQNICINCGVKVVYTPCIKKAPLSGATRWIGDNPLIQLSGRYKQNDRFWFTFFHEVGHILMHGKKDIFLEDIEYSKGDLKKEAEANEFAKAWIVSKRVKPTLSIRV